MRNKITLVFLFSLLIPIHFSSSYTELKPAGIYTAPIGSSSNPLHIQVEQDPTQSWQVAWDKINSMQYVAACSQKYNDVKSLARKNGFGDIADPVTAKSNANYLNYLYSSYQSCVNNAAQAQNQYFASQPQKVSVQNVLDEFCQNTFGVNSIYTGETDKSKNGNTGGCSCLKGYGWNNDMSKCITESKETNDLLCFNKFGVGIIWNGTKNDKGETVCSCKEGYVEHDNKCIVTSIIPAKSNNLIGKTGGGGGGSTPISSGLSTVGNETAAEHKINNDICKMSDPNSHYSGFLNEEGNPACACDPSYTRPNKITDLCIKDAEDTIKLDNVQNIEQSIKTKSLWEKIKGWLGF